jgi:hypothetical protein
MKSQIGKINFPVSETVFDLRLEHIIQPFALIALFFQVLSVLDDRLLDLPDHLTALIARSLLTNLARAIASHRYH